MLYGAKSVGCIGLSINCKPIANGLRLVGWMYPIRGGRDGRSSLCRHLEQKGLEDVWLNSERSKLYPDWNDLRHIIWFDKKLPLDTTRQELQGQLKQQGGKLLRLARPKLEELAQKKR